MRIFQKYQNFDFAIVPNPVIPWVCFGEATCPDLNKDNGSSEYSRPYLPRHVSSRKNIKLHLTFVYAPGFRDSSKVSQSLPGLAKDLLTWEGKLPLGEGKFINVTINNLTRA
jgi:hypothetical protein